jgi:hypothetical protein
MSEHDVMAKVFRAVLAENRYAFRELGVYTNQDGRQGFRRFAQIGNEVVYLTESATSVGRDINLLVEMVERAEIDRSKSVEYHNRELGLGRRIEFWCDGVWLHMFAPNPPRY